MTQPERLYRVEVQQEMWSSARRVIWVIATALAVFVFFGSTTWTMVRLWNTSGTYSHCFLVLPAFVWLLWERRSALSRLSASPAWPALLVLTLLGLIWFVADLAAANAPAQLAMVAIVSATVAAVFGWQWARALAFPLAFLFMAVPVGDFLIPHMMNWTADFTVATLQMSGVPVRRNGLYFSIPSGNWEVVEACSGFRYLFASLMAALIFAGSFYRSTASRAAFVIGVLALAVIANWLRAYGIVLLAHLTDNRLATEVDHFAYGWVFFAVVMSIAFGVGLFYWRQGVAPEPRMAVSTIPTPTAFPVAVTLAVASALIVWPLVAFVTDRGSRNFPKLVGIEPRGGWTPTSELVAPWVPNLSNPTQVWTETFANGRQRVSVYLGVFERAMPNSKLVSSSNRMVGDGSAEWRLESVGAIHASRGERTFSFRTATIVGKHTRLVAWHWYWIGGRHTTSLRDAALLQVLARLRGESERSVWISVVAIDDGSAQDNLKRFVSDMLISIDDALSASPR